MNKDSKGFAHLVLIITVVLIGIVGIGYFTFKSGQIKINSNNPTTPTPTPTPQGGTSSERIKLTLGSLSFKVSPNWYANHVVNEWYPIETYHIDTLSSTKPTERVTTFLLRLDEERTTLEAKAQEIAGTWRLLEVTSKKTKVGGVDGIFVEGRVNPVNNYNSRFLDNAKVKVVVFILDNEVYHLMGEVTNEARRREFDQILSSFEFIGVDDITYCDANTICETGDCYLFPRETKAQCFEGDPCSKCTSGKCAVLETYPNGVLCIDN